MALQAKLSIWAVIYNQHFYFLHFVTLTSLSKPKTAFYVANALAVWNIQPAQMWSATVKTELSYHNVELIMCVGRKQFIFWVYLINLKSKLYTKHHFNVEMYYLCIWLLFWWHCHYRNASQFDCVCCNLNRVELKYSEKCMFINDKKKKYWQNNHVS